LGLGAGSQSGYVTSDGSLEKNIEVYTLNKFAYQLTADFLKISPNSLKITKTEPPQTQNIKALIGKPNGKGLTLPLTRDMFSENITLDNLKQVLTSDKSWYMFKSDYDVLQRKIQSKFQETHALVDTKLTAGRQKRKMPPTVEYLPKMARKIPQAMPSFSLDQLQFLREVSNDTSAWNDFLKDVLKVSGKK
jgi:hypothetical protein